MSNTRPWSVCIFCGDPTPDYTYIGNSKIWHCTSNECLMALEREQRDEAECCRVDETFERWEKDFE